MLHISGGLIFLKKNPKWWFASVIIYLIRSLYSFQVGENEPFVSELLSGLPSTIADLEPHQIHTFYESVCIIFILYAKLFYSWISILSFLLLFCRLVIWSKQNLIHRRGTNICRDWWNFRIRSVKLCYLWLNLVLSVSLKNACVECCICGFSDVLRKLVLFAEMGWNYWTGTPKCWFPEGSRCDPDCA